MKTSQAAFPDLRELVKLFYDRQEELGHFQEVKSGQMPAVYRSLLDHEHHMTVTVESHHRSPVDVQVLDCKTEGDTYMRRILLKRQSDGRVVQYGIVRLHVCYLSSAVRAEIESQQIPLGRVLINHDVLRRVELGQLWRVTPGVDLRQHFQLEAATITFGRTAIIHCDHEPAVELLEIVAPEPDQ